MITCFVFSLRTINTFHFTGNEDIRNCNLVFMEVQRKEERKKERRGDERGLERKQGD